MSQTPWSEWVNEAWITVDFCDHPVRPWTDGERCWYCKDLATHKIEESDVYEGHPMTAYVCCMHFFGHRT